MQLLLRPVQLSVQVLATVCSVPADRERSGMLLLDERQLLHLQLRAGERRVKLADLLLPVVPLLAEELLGPRVLFELALVVLRHPPGILCDVPHLRLQLLAALVRRPGILPQLVLHANPVPEFVCLLLAAHELLLGARKLRLQRGHPALLLPQLLGPGSRLAPEAGDGPAVLLQGRVQGLELLLVQLLLQLLALCPLPFHHRLVGCNLAIQN
mmetsp:Transcript_60670/g.172444  ORF Transcript_60670/g.172444 Transcript_60670/m.172444 type:complete len:212 (+) Transcript_60670:585-1220(+)